ncbi:MAG: corrinoid protein [Deltaproteobacteria bacterium]|nr:corrinoid protein [Deltaproteobacteria bacterium]
MDHLFKVIAPGHHFVASIGDTTPPAADFDRLIYIAERIEKEGRLPLATGSFRPVSEETLQTAGQGTVAETKGSVPVKIDTAYETVLEDVLKGNQEKVVENVRYLLDQGYEALDILNIGMLPAMEVIGAKFADGTVFIPEVLLSARAMNAALKILEPHLTTKERQSPGKIMIGTVRGDLHNIGKNLVITMFKGVGFEVVDLGVNVKVEDFVAEVKKHMPQILGLSALLTTTMPQAKDVIDAVMEAGLRDKVQVIIGGAPVNQKFADDIKADGYAANAGEAVDLAKRLLKI